jgi:hypothetical protein
LPENFANGGLKDRSLIAAVGIELQQEWMQAKQSSVKNLKAIEWAG